jgi:23S rRNA (cytidine1920-2'-O)/16S rRNA (cytidine1409-2'-O)-methyltransferase
MRADLLLVEQGFATSRNRAQELIATGRVFVVTRGQRQVVKKPSLQIEDGQIEVAPDPEALHYVSRGGLKMRGALDRLGLSVDGARVLDIGISTGGFTDCLLQAGARSVVGVDVGHGQLAPQLENDARLQLIEGVNARDLTQADLLTKNGGQKFDLIVADVSFISLTLVLPAMISYLKESASILALVKPQFEVGREGLGKNGIVKDSSLYPLVEKKIRDSAQSAGLLVEDYFESAIKGYDGNREFFLYARSPELSLDLSLGLFGHAARRGPTPPDEL